MKIYREEVFGPFVVIASFETEEEALAKANDTTYGLGSAVFTRDIVKGHRMARNIEAGMVWINSSNDSDYRIPFGGVKMSGIGRELGEAGLAAYTNSKVSPPVSQPASQPLSCCPFTPSTHIHTYTPTSTKWPH
jgi:aldehyde dehydrogenase (NAD+)